MGRVLALSAVLGALAVPAGAGAYDGVWDLETCSPMNVSRITVAGDMIALYESQCRLSGPVAVRDMAGATLYEMSCEGEGEVWRRRILLMTGFGDTLIRAEEGFALTYRRCR